MSNILEKIKLQKSLKECPDEGEDSSYVDLGWVARGGWEDGFDYALSLNIPVLFFQWTNNNVSDAFGEIIYLHNGEKFDSAQALFEYFTDNVLESLLNK